MRDILTGLESWFDRGENFALATVVRTWKSSPRAPGAAMAVSQSGEVLGSVSGGCVESALYETARDVLADGRSRTEVFCVADDDAIGVGLTCGGTIEVFVQRIGPVDFQDFASVARRIRGGESIAVVTETGDGARTRRCVIASDGPVGDLELSETDVESVRRRLDAGESVVYQLQSDTVCMVEIFAPPPRMYVFGAIDFAAAMCTLGAFAGYHVTVIDARAVFATRARFPDADDVVVMWPHRFLETAPVDHRTVLAVLTHDEKFDIPLLRLALRSDAAYIGAMGSRATHERRVALLREQGTTARELARLHSPIGLDLGARTPEETAVSILAEMMKTTRGTSGRGLQQLTGPIHRDAPAGTGRPAECTV
ncbi:MULTISPECIES: XdhC family protein [unclassified Rhodococcus (in: high G+C Gram-positive bacteria)]|uniref:XdhC family protein n=1 Tax=unclassified Rhodococcus (in: high G+C Gram-positive bacteria) TaxID=192944 RepID=UPI00163AD0E6|nr:MULTISPECIES: XdhC family protein [unclassified Rhodococcus (in: high G+C Gram-positive bacteria)]MBC2640943.1 XdhC family protein [Rhodococcus sp. 3A]MBC2894314.1 XdhC family protein [Rhodococcus sp. 4CII]